MKISGGKYLLNAVSVKRYRGPPGDVQKADVLESPFSLDDIFRIDEDGNIISHESAWNEDPDVIFISFLPELLRWKK